MTRHAEAITDERSESDAWRGFAWALARDLRLAMRSRAELGVQLLFYVIVVTLFPLGVGAEPALLRALGPGRAVGRGAARLAACRCRASSRPTTPTARSSRSRCRRYPLPALIVG